MNVIMQLSPSQLNTLDAGLRCVRARIPAATIDSAFRRLVEKEVTLLLMSVGVTMDLYIGLDDGWDAFCERGNSSEFRLESLYSCRRKSVENCGDWTSYASIICLVSSKTVRIAQYLLGFFLVPVDVVRTNRHMFVSM